MSIIIKETLRQPRAVLAVDAFLSGPLLAVSMDVFVTKCNTEVLVTKCNTEVFVTKFKTVTIACETRIKHGDWQLVDHFFLR